ncbi:MAG: tetrahydromethanopterin S-methyltransferase subunit H [Candidatus Methanomethylicia archaeon]
MLKFKTPQKVFEIGGIKVGGQPGENPTVLIGSIFYHGHRIVLNEKTGEFNREKAEKLIKLKEEFIGKTGIPGMLDVIASTKEAMCKFIEFSVNTTNMPILIDSPSAEVKIAGVKYAKEIGIEDKIVYNSLIPESKEVEFKAIMEYGIKSAILLAYKSGVMSSKMRMEALKELLKKAEDAGVTKPLLDTFVIDIPSLSIACKTIIDLKGELGYPCGCGAHNAITTWIGLKKFMGVEAVKPCDIAVNIMPIILGADFVIYGPIENCKYIYPATYAINTSYKYLKRMGEQKEI